MKLYLKIIYAILVLILVFTLIWGINIIPKQMDFDNSCKQNCLSKGLEYETRVNSYPWNNVNGKCYCKNLTYIEMVNDFGGLE